MFEYSSRKTIISNLSLLSKAFIFLVFVILAMIFSDPIVLMPILIVCISMCLISGMSISKMANSIKPILVIFAFLFVFTAFTYNIELAKHEYAKVILMDVYDGSLVDIRLSSGGLLFGLGFILKMLIMMYASALLAFTSPIEDLLYGLQKIGLPYQIGLMLTIAIRFIPTLTLEVEQIQQAQIARGSQINQKNNPAQAVRRTIPLFVPMIVSSIRRSDTMAMSMISRGYGYTNHRTVLVEIKYLFIDYITIFLLLAITGLLIVLNRQTGLGVL